MSYYDQELKPWEILDGKCVVADESEWQKVNQLTDGYFNKVYLHNPGGAKIGEYPKRPVVKVPTDIFEDVKGLVVDSDGERIYSCHGCGGLQLMQYNDCDWGTVLSDRVAKKTS